MSEKSSSGLDHETTAVEPQPTARTKRGRRIIGKLNDEDSVSITAPSSLKKGTRMVPRGSAGLRAPPPTKKDDEGTGSHHEAREKVQQHRESHRQQVWDKLDAAKRFADERQPRLKRFMPQKMDDEDPVHTGASDSSADGDLEEPDKD
jgi:hypothetical protein